MVDGGYCRNVLAGASSHFSTAERQFRLPLEHGNQRDLTAQWTATASGAVVISSERKSHICLHPCYHRKNRGSGNYRF